MFKGLKTSLKHASLHAWFQAVSFCPFLLAVAVDNGGTIRFVNLKFAELLGLPRHALHGRNLSKITGDVNGDTSPAERAIAERSALRDLWTVATQDGRRITLESWTLPLTQTRRTLGAIVFAIQRTDVPASEPIRRSQPMINQPKVEESRIDHLKRFASFAAHEIQNPLAAISATAQLLGKTDPRSERVDRLAARIGKSVEDALQVLADLRALSAPVQLTSKASVNSLVQEVVDEFEPIAFASELRIKTQLDDTLPEILCDQARLKQVFVNLVKNAIEAGSKRQERGIVSIRTRFTATRGSVIVFHNWGPPIPSEIRDRIFEPFFSTKKEGSGLGLAICQEIVVNGHKGRIAVRSGSLFGTVFRITIPV